MVMNQMMRNADTDAPSDIARAEPDETMDSSSPREIKAPRPMPTIRGRSFLMSRMRFSLLCFSIWSFLSLFPGTEEEDLVSFANFLSLLFSSQPIISTSVFSSSGP